MNKFVIISLGFLGDTLLVEPLCKNIKNKFPNSEIIFIANSIFEDIPKGFKSVDKIYSYDKKNKHSGILGYFKFLKDFCETDIDYAIITHPHERSLILAKFIKAKNIISLPIKKSLLNIFINIKRKFITDEIRHIYKADYNNAYLQKICEHENLSVEYIREDIDDNNILIKFNLPNEYIVLSPVSKDLIKDWDYENIKNFINNANKKVVLVGTNKAFDIANQLVKDNVNFINLTNKTSIAELGCVIKNSTACVSVDTGTFHFSYAQKVKTIGLFFNKKMVAEWAPSNLKYVKVLCGDKKEFNSKIICNKNINYLEVLKEL